MHLILSAFGSYGDVLPMVGIGATAASRGHRVQVIVNPYFQSVVEQAGLEMLPLGTADEYRELMQHPDLWHPQRGLRLVFGTASKYLRQMYELVEMHHRPGESVIAAHALDFASRVLHDKRRVPLATVHFTPMAMMSLDDPPRYMNMPSVARWPRWAKASILWAGDRLVVDRIVGPRLNALRNEVGLPPVQRIFSRWLNSPELVLGLFPEWFGTPQADWPRQAAMVGFPLWDPPSDASLTGEVAAFLDAGDPPIVFAPGSANSQATDFFQVAADVCRQLGRRGMLMTKYPEQIPPRLPSGVQRFGFVPFGGLLPRVAALVHHGGIGTCAQGLANALPQIVMPMAYDQLDNGVRLERLGVGAIVRPKHFRTERVAAELARLLESADVRLACQTLAARCDGTASLEAACDLLEKLHRRVVITH